MSQKAGKILEVSDLPSRTEEEVAHICCMDASYSLQAYSQEADGPHKEIGQLLLHYKMLRMRAHR